MSHANDLQLLCFFWMTLASQGDMAAGHTMASVIQKNGESLREFMQRFCSKRNIIPEVDDSQLSCSSRRDLGTLP
jgi:hypothetical protein